MIYIKRTQTCLFSSGRWPRIGAVPVATCLYMYIFCKITPMKSQIKNKNVQSPTDIMYDNHVNILCEIILTPNS